MRRGRNGFGCYAKQRSYSEPLYQNSNFNVVGGAGCLSLFLLMLASLNPLVGVPVSALEGGDFDGGGEKYISSDGASVGNEGIMVTASTPSTVTISFLPTSVNESVVPVDASGAKARVDVKATVRVQNSGGYKVYVGSDSSQLKNGASVIDSVTEATTFANLPLNRWGYSFAKGTTAADNYVAMPSTLKETALDANSSTNIADETRNYMLSFAVNVGLEKPEGLYTNSVTMSVVSSPLEIVTLKSITNMQEMTSAICSASAVNESKQLKDTRDGKYYWVAKLADGKCWMTQNLDLDLSTSKALTSADSDVASSWTPGYSTATVANSTTVLSSNTGQRSWSLGDYRIADPAGTSSCGSGKNQLSQCTSQFTAQATPTTANGDVNAHYIVGNYYQWNAATAGTGGAITSGQASSSICAKGWKLPTSNSTAAGSFGGLMNAYSITSSAAGMAKMTGSPLYFVRGGNVDQGTSSLLNYAGAEGRYWPSTPYSLASDAYYLRIYSTTSIEPSRNLARQRGLTIRCVAK